MASMQCQGTDADALLQNLQVVGGDRRPPVYTAAPDDEALPRDVELAKPKGYNGVRKQQKLEIKCWDGPELSSRRAQRATPWCSTPRAWRRATRR